MKFVLSTMTMNIGYTFYNTPEAKNLPATQKAKVTIYGGANLPSNRSGFGNVSTDAEGHPIWTAAGIVTPVPDDKLEMLKSHYLFKRHLEAGRVKIVNEDITGNHAAVEKHVRTMAKSDGFAQLTKETLKQKINVKTPMELERETGFRI